MRISRRAEGAAGGRLEPACRQGALLSQTPLLSHLFIPQKVCTVVLPNVFFLSLFITLSVIILIFMKAFRAFRVGARANKSFNLFPFCLALICPDVRHLYPAQTHLLLVVSDPPLVFKLSSPSHPCQYCCVCVSLCSPSCLSLPTS